MVVAILLLVVASFAAGFVAMTMTSSQSALTTTSNNTAYSLAMAGIENGSYQLALGTCNSAWSATTAVSGGGEYRFNCTAHTASSTLSAAITNTQTTIMLNSVTGFASFGAVTINSETVFYNGISGTTLQNVRRGMNGTTAAAQPLGATAAQSQYIIGSEGGYPYLTTATANGIVRLSQSVFATSSSSYYTVGTSGTAGTILSYNGNSWTTALTGPNGFVFQGIFLSSTYGQAVGFNASNSGSIYQFNGTSWSSLSTGLTALQLYDVACDVPLAPTRCWSSGRQTSSSRGLAYITAPVSLASGSNQNFNAYVSCNNGVCMAVGHRNTYRFSSTVASNLALSTQVQVSPGSTRFNNVDCPLNNRCIAVTTNNGVFYHNGTSWSGPFGITSARLNGVHCPTSSFCVVVGDGGRIYNCTLPVTSVASCTVVTAPGTMNLNAVYCNSSTDCLAVARGASSVAYRNIGGNWSSVSLPASYTMNGVAGISSGGGSAVVTPTVLLEP